MRHIKGEKIFWGELGGEKQEYREYGSICGLAVEGWLGTIAHILVIPVLER